MNKMINFLRKTFKNNKNLSNVASGDFISNVIGALFWLYLAVLLTPKEYGEITYLVSIAAFASTLSMLGAYNSIVVLTAKNVKIQATINFISSSAGLIAAIIVFFYIDKIEIGFLIFTYIFTNLIIPHIIGKKQFNEYFKIIVISKILTVVSSLVLFYFIGYLGVIIGLSTPLLLFSYKIFHIFNSIKIDFKLLKIHSRFVVTNYVLNISDSVAGSLDRMIIGPLLGFAILASYQLGWQFFGILMVIPGIVYKITLPDDAQGISNHRLKIVTVSVASGLGILSFILIPLVIPLINSEYNDSVLPIQIMALGSIPGSIALMYWSKFIGTQKNKILLGGSSIYATSLITLIIILGQNFDSLGLASAFTISQIISMTYFMCANHFLKNC